MKDILAILGVVCVFTVGLWMLVSVLTFVLMPLLGVFGAVLGFR